MQSSSAPVTMQSTRGGCGCILMLQPRLGSDRVSGRRGRQKQGLLVQHFLDCNSPAAIFFDAILTHGRGS
ncbi:hypothetical protein RSAG8_01594, partial [Rhizoctonia solani AG-8 WAC10335]